MNRFQKIYKLLVVFFIVLFFMILVVIYSFLQNKEEIKHQENIFYTLNLHKNIQELLDIKLENRSEERRVGKEC